MIKITIFVISILTLINLAISLKVILTCSGGGIRASTGCFIAIKKFKSWGKNGDHAYGIFERYGISGGSWGLILEEHIRDVNTFKNQIHTVITNHQTWGPRTPSVGGVWHDKWANDIKRHILEPCGINNDPQWRNYIQQHHKLMITAARFTKRSDPLEHCDFGFDEFYCPSNDLHISSNNLRTANTYTTLSDVLTYSSSAWASPKSPFDITPKILKDNSNSNEYKLYDGGIYLNTPILNPILRHVDEGDDIILISFDFSNTKFKKKGKIMKDELARVRKTTKLFKKTFDGNLMEKIVNEFENQQCKAVCDDEDQTVYAENSNFNSGKYFKFVHVPLYGHTSGWEIYQDYPTRSGSKAITWDQQQFDDFIDEWSQHLDNIKDKILIAIN